MNYSFYCVEDESGMIYEAFCQPTCLTFVNNAFNLIGEISIIDQGGWSILYSGNLLDTSKGNCYDYEYEGVVEQLMSLFKEDLVRLKDLYIEAFGKYCPILEIENGNNALKNWHPKTKLSLSFNGADSDIEDLVNYKFERQLDEDELVKLGVEF